MQNITDCLRSLQLPESSSHKGQNGRVMIIGGSELFHAASKWSLDVASKFVDMVFYASVPVNNKLVKEAKGKFWNGIVIPRGELTSYVSEADSILVGPGMAREKRVGDDWIQRLLQAVGNVAKLQKIAQEIDWQNDTFAVTNYLLAVYPEKKWVVDAGALQMVEPKLLNKNMILTPHKQEFDRLMSQVPEWESEEKISAKNIAQFSELLGGVTILIKGVVDLLANSTQTLEISGGNAGMTKGGTGDVLAGLIAALYAKNDLWVASVVGSYINKCAGDDLYHRVGPNFNSSDLVQQIPQTLWREREKALRSKLSIH